MARKGVLPYLIKKDPQNEEVGGDVVAENPSLGIMPPGFASCRRYTSSRYWALTRKPLLGIRMGHTLQSTEGSVE